MTATTIEKNLKTEHLKHASFLLRKKKKAILRWSFASCVDSLIKNLPFWEFHFKWKTNGV